MEIKVILDMSQQTPVRIRSGKEKKNKGDSQLRYAKSPGALKPPQKSLVLSFPDFINIFLHEVVCECCQQS